MAADHMCERCACAGISVARSDCLVQSFCSISSFPSRPVVRLLIAKTCGIICGLFMGCRLVPVVGAVFVGCRLVPVVGAAACRFLPPGFPQAAPRIQVSPPFTHPLVDAQMNVVAPGLQSVSMCSSYEPRCNIPTHPWVCITSPWVVYITPPCGCCTLFTCGAHTQLNVHDSYRLCLLASLCCCGHGMG